ncbi:MAG: LuxR C-terminal-related transcriptional regulator [Dysgonamonadaceae bacterium]|jgi:DNA-binding NarL/FixJ family response regulator|nr:LuxR C-terminal-related transcriptional regulator [Dysgonamonadaceae bacterium]
MNRHKHQLAVIEPSQIIFAGIMEAFRNAETATQLTGIDGLDKFIRLTDENNPFDMVIVNPAVLPNRIKEIRKIKRTYPKLVFVGISANLVDNELLSLYDEMFSIYDNIEHITQRCQKLMQEYSSDKQDDDNENLSEREVEVLKLLIKGMANKEIAELLGISFHTVASHRKNISIKTGIRSQSGLTIYAISKKIVSLEDFD